MYLNRITLIGFLGGDAEKKVKFIKVNAHHVGLFAKFVERLQNTPDGNGTLLDHSMVMLGSGISDGDRHNHDELPIVLAGKGGGTGIALAEIYNVK